MGCTVIAAENGQQAVDILTGDVGQSHDFGLVLMDMQMPVMDGIESTRRIRQAGITADQLPIVALTANAFVEDRNACAAAGMQDHVSKPIQFNDLHQAVCNWYFDPSAANAVSAVAAEDEDPTIAMLRPKYEEFRSKTLDGLLAGANTIDSWSVSQSEEIKSMLHKLAGSAGTFGEGEIAAAAKQLEGAIQQGKQSDILIALSTKLLKYRRPDQTTNVSKAAS